MLAYIYVAHSASHASIQRDRHMRRRKQLRNLNEL